MQKTETFIATLRKAGLRITPQRRLICAYLANTNSHPSAYQVYDALSVSNPDLSLATVYNTLNVLRDLGAIVEISVGTVHTHYETDTSPHVNLVCLNCRRIVDYHAPHTLEQMREHVVANTGFMPMVGKIELLGFCAVCRERKREEIRQKATAEQTTAQAEKSTEEVE